MFAVFARMEEVGPEDNEVLPSATATVARWQDWAKEQWRHTYQVELTSFVAAHQLGCNDSAGLLVVPGLRFTKAAQLVTDEEAIPWHAFHLNLPQRQAAAAEARPAAPGGGGGQASLDLLAAYPWLAGLAERQARPRPGQARGSAASGTPAAMAAPPGGPEGEEEELEAVFAELYRRREEWAVLAPLGGEDFVTGVLGGAWTKRERGRVYDAYQGRAAHRASQDFCERYGLQKSARFGIDVFGDRMAGQLSRAWCHRLQYYYDLEAARGRDSGFTAEDHGQYEEPAYVAAMEATMTERQRARLAGLRAQRPTISGGGA